MRGRWPSPPLRPRRRCFRFLRSDLERRFLSRTRRRFEDDRARDRTLTVAGWRVVRFTDRALNDGPHTVRAQLDWLPAVTASGGWALLLDTEAMGVPAADASRRLLEQKVAATPMTVWGETVAPRYVRFVFSREPVERLELLGERVRAALS